MHITAIFEVPDGTRGGCLKTGPFYGIKTHIDIDLGYPGYQIEKVKAHCIRRDFAPVTQWNNALVSDLERVMQLPDYRHFDRVTEREFHISGHYRPGGLYGELSDRYTSGMSFSLV
jgi:hypothetical protein